MVDLKDGKKTWLERQTEKLRYIGILSSEESISGVFEENVCLSSVADWCDIVNRRLEKDIDIVVISLPSCKLYEEIAAFLRYRPHPELKWIGRSTECWCNSAHEAEVHAKYKSVLKKVKPVATHVQLPGDSEQQVELAAKQPNLRDVRSTGHKFTPDTLMRLKIEEDDFPTDCEKKKFEEMIRSTGPIIDDVVDEFAGRAIYSVGDLYSSYDQFQLAVESRDLITIRTPLGLMRMCTLPQGATNSVAHMQNAMHKVLREFVPKISIPFLDDIPIKGCATEEKTRL
ncbi:hypothetical protein R1sor_004529 [Riccia sorocarpa]|uniref:Uncharacterized protein n=1 Tax=Riccia sorocarpa TaxID=122646 RepID=A0ABD3HHI9_9MARC